MYGMPVNLKTRSLSTGSSTGRSRLWGQTFPSRIALFEPATCWALGQWVVPRRPLLRAESAVFLPGRSTRVRILEGKHGKEVRVVDLRSKASFFLSRSSCVASATGMKHVYTAKRSCFVWVGTL